MFSLNSPSSPPCSIFNALYRVPVALLTTYTTSNDNNISFPFLHSALLHLWWYVTVCSALLYSTNSLFIPKTLSQPCKIQTNANCLHHRRSRISFCFGLQEWFKFALPATTEMQRNAGIFAIKLNMNHQNCKLGVKSIYGIFSRKKGRFSLSFSKCKGCKVLDQILFRSH